MDNRILDPVERGFADIIMRFQSLSGCIVPFAHRLAIMIGNSYKDGVLNAVFAHQNAAVEKVNSVNLCHDCRVKCLEALNENTDPRKESDADGKAEALEDFEEGKKSMKGLIFKVTAPLSAGSQQLFKGDQVIVTKHRPGSLPWFSRVDQQDDEARHFPLTKEEIEGNLEYVE